MFFLPTKHLLPKLKKPHSPSFFLQRPWWLPPDLTSVYYCVSCVLWEPKLDVVSRCTLPSAKFSETITSLGLWAVLLLGCCWPSLHHDPQALSAELLPRQAGSPQLVSLQAVLPPQVQDFEFHQVPVSPSFQPVWVQSRGLTCLYWLVLPIWCHP